MIDRVKARLYVVRDYVDGAIEALFEKQEEAQAFSRMLTNSVMELHHVEGIDIDVSSYDPYNHTGANV